MTPHGSMWCASEKAQVYARDLRLGDDAPLVYLPRGGAERFRSAARDGHLVCPLPGCDQPRVVVRAGSRRDHFAHQCAPGTHHAPESLMHLQAKEMVRAWLATLCGGQLRVEVEAAIDDRVRVADVLATSPKTMRKMAFEVQYATITVDEWRQRHADYEERGITDVWLWGHLSRHCRAPGPDAHENERGITPAMWACRETTGRPLLWINPEMQQLAVGITSLDLDPEDVGTLGLAGACNLSWRFAYDHGAALARASDLSEWKLTGEGPHGPHHDAVQRAAAKKRKRQADRDAAVQAAKRRREAAARRKAEQAAWRAAKADKILERRDQHRRRDDESWARAKPQLLAQVGGSIPEVISQPLKTDGYVFMAGEHWRAIVYARLIYRLQPGHSFTYRDACRTVFGALADVGVTVRDGHRVYYAITELLFRLRRAGVIAFDEVGAFIPGPITLGPRHRNAPPPTPDELRVRRERAELALKLRREFDEREQERARLADTPPDLTDATVIVAVQGRKRLLTRDNELVWVGAEGEILSREPNRGRWGAPLQQHA